MSLISLAIVLVIAWIIGIVADKLSPFHMPGSWVGAIIAGLLGSWVGPGILGNWGPSVAGITLVPSLIGAILVVLVIGGLTKLSDK
jgi:uncharacterized membrane protein YeaQ/YmgE (transglycosylase-associated protein family)